MSRASPQFNEIQKQLLSNLDLLIHNRIQKNEEQCLFSRFTNWPISLGWGRLLKGNFIFSTRNLLAQAIAKESATNWLAKQRNAW